MSLVSPSASSRKILSVTDTAVSGTVNYPFTIPQDSTAIVCKFWTASGAIFNSTGLAQVYIQTSEDGGTTWRDTAGWTTNGAIVNDIAHFQSIPCMGTAYGRGLGGWTGSVQASTLAPALVASVATGASNGIPMMGTLGRVFIKYTALVSVGGINVDIFAPSNDKAS